VGRWKTWKPCHVAPDDGRTDISTANHNHSWPTLLPHSSQHTHLHFHSYFSLALLLFSVIRDTHIRLVFLCLHTYALGCASRLTNHKAITTQETWHITPPLARGTLDAVLASHYLRNSRLSWVHHRCHPRRLRNIRRRSLNSTRANPRPRYKQSGCFTSSSRKTKRGICTASEVFVSQDGNRRRRLTAKHKWKWHRRTVWREEA
jgi:hypothetical protein